MTDKNLPLVHSDVAPFRAPKMEECFPQPKPMLDRHNNPIKPKRTQPSFVEPRYVRMHDAMTIERAMLDDFLIDIEYSRITGYWTVSVVFGNGYQNTIAVCWKHGDLRLSEEEIGSIVDPSFVQGMACRKVFLEANDFRVMHCLYSDEGGQ